MSKCRMFLFALCSLLTLTGCFENTVKIGVALPLSGASTPRGQEILNAVLLAVEDVNHYGGVKGHKVEVKIADDQDTPLKGKEAAESLIQQHVLGVVGHYSSDVTLAVLPFYADAKTALVSPSVSLSQIPSEGSTFFRTLGSNQQQARAAAAFIQASGFRRIAIVHNASLYAQDLSKSLQTSLNEFPAIHRYLLEDDPDCVDRLKRLLPELVFYAGGYQDASQFLQRLRESGQQPAFMGGNSLSDSEFIRQVGLTQVKEVWITAGGSPPSAFLDRYRQRFGRPGPFSAYAYDAARLLLSAAEQAESLDASSVRLELSRRKLYQGLTGAILLDPTSRAASRSDFGILAITPEGKFVSATPIKPLFSPAGQLTGNLARSALYSLPLIKASVPPSPSAPKQ